MIFLYRIRQKKVEQIASLLFFDDFFWKGFKNLSKTYLQIFNITNVFKILFLVRDSFLYIYLSKVLLT